MIFVFYGCLVAGLIVVAMAATDRLHTSRQTARVAHGVGTLAATLVALTPFWTAQVFRYPGDGTNPALLSIGVLDLVASTALVAGANSSHVRSIVRPEIAYLVLLAVGALPSWVLLPMAPAVLLAGACLVRAERTPERRLAEGSSPR